MSDNNIIELSSIMLWRSVSGPMKYKVLDGALVVTANTLPEMRCAKGSIIDIKKGVLYHFRPQRKVTLERIEETDTLELAPIAQKAESLPDEPIEINASDFLRPGRGNQ